MNVLDVVLVLAALAFAVSGYRQGFIVGVLSFAGYIGGGVLGMVVAPKLLAGWDPGVSQSLVAVLVVLAMATLGQVIAALAGARLRAFVTWQPARVVDATLGAAASVTAMLLIAWFVASAVGQATVPTVSRAVRDSKIIVAVDRVMPDSARNLFSSFRDVLDANGFPQVFSGLTPERIVPVEPPDEAVLRSRAVRVARGSVVKVLGSARECSKQVEGSGFVFAPQRVMTNAHVVAGVDAPVVQVGGEGRHLEAQVVLYDSDRDVAVLRVPDLDAPSLSFGPAAERGDAAVVVGFPRNGPFRADAARVRNEQSARGPDIYNTHSTTRDVYAIYARVQPGNSGGPLLSPSGAVYGVIFAASLDDSRTGYALTAAEVRSAVRQGRSASTTADTGGCTS